MDIRVRYTCEGRDRHGALRDRDYIVSPIGSGIYNTLEEYQSEMLRLCMRKMIQKLLSLSYE
jgi:hypothetical protein